MAGHILLAEDDKTLSALMQDFFRAAGVTVTPAYDGEQALVLAQAQPFDLLVLDVMMPHLNGLEVCEAVRQESDVPVIFVTALGQEGDTLAGFRAGADDYITKPFSFPVLVAKAQALMRRARGLRLGASELGYANILMDTASGVVTVDGNPVNLRPKEAKILELLLREQGRTVSRDLLIERVWGTDFDGDERMIDRHIASLRKALGTASQHIRAVYGKGYRLGGIDMTKRIHKIGIAARLTAVVAVILAVFLVPWVWRVAELAQDEAREEAKASMEANTGWLMRDLEVLKGDAARYPAAGTEEYDLLRANLCRDGVDTPYYNVNTPYIIRYYDENHKRVLIRSPLMLYYHPATGCCYGIDLSDFSEQSLREMNEALDHDLAEPIITVYGRQVKTDTQFVFFPNRIQIAYDEWTAQTPVEETNQFRSDEGDYIQGVWPFRTDEVMEGYFDALRYLDTELRAIDGENIPDEEWAEVRASKRYVGTFQGMPYDDEVLLATAALVNREYAYGTCFRLMPPITIALYLIFLFLFYKIVRRMVSDPLVDTAREANRVSILAFDEFKPDLNRGDEIGELNRALSEMAATLHTRWDSERDLEDKRQQFVSAASHDLKTPLALIGGYAEAIAQDISPEENARYLAAIEQETDRMNGLVREMLDYTRLDRTDELKNRKTLNLTALVRDMLTEYAPLFEKRRLTADIADGVRIRGDETLLRRAVGCLLENAAKYSPENGRVSVRLTNSRNHLLTVENDCEPIPEDELPRLFEMFYRGDKARDRAGGHGLGLAILQKILALHGLTCKAENIKGGVRFIVCNKD